MRDAEADPGLTEEWGQQLHDLFVQALQTPEESRAQYLREHCQNAQLRDEVGRLLAEDEAAKQSDFLRLQKTHPFSQHATSDIDDPLVGQEVGAYRIEEWVASGGMGSVYRATRINDFRHSVALKVARHGFGNEELNRFATERQILADLNHPFIAQILDGGTTPQGQPYFVMEFIRGRPIDGYCFEEDLSLDARVSLFVQVCRAVQHAHERGVIHRDVKPSNILVNDDGIPKLTDFGIARLVEDDSEQTQTGVLIGTPSYISPEQACGRRNEVGPISDVFSLGAVLYKLLTGKVAFQGDSWKETIDRVCTSDPVRPRAHHADISVELEAICLKCLEKEPRRRYESARQLADDLQRWSDGLPVLARPIGPIQRWTRSVDLQQWTGVTTLVALMAAFLGAGWMAMRDDGNHVVGTNATLYGTSALIETPEEFERQAALLAEQKDYMRRLEFNHQLSRIHEISDSKPGLARQWLSDPVRCPPELRAFAWSHLQQRTSRHLRRWSTNHRVPPVMTFLRGDELLATLTQRQLVLWDIAQEIRVEQRRGPGTGVVFLASSSDGSVLVAPQADHSMVLLRPDAEEIRLNVALRAESRTCAAVTDGADRLALGSEDGVIELWDVAGERQLSTWHAHDKRIYSLGFSSDGRKIVSYGRDHKIKTWDVSTETLITAVQIEVTERQHQDLSPTADLLAVGERYGKISVWDCETGTSLLQMLDTGGKVPKVTFSPRPGEFAAAVSERGSAGELARIMIFNADSSEPWLEWTVPKIGGFVFSSDGSRLVTATSKGNASLADIWNVDARAGVEAISPESTVPAQAIAWGHEDDQLLCGTSDGSLNVIDAGRSLTRSVYKYEGAVRQIATTATGRLAAAVETDVHVLTQAARDAIPHPLVFTAGHLPGSRVTCVAFSSDGQMLAGGSRGGVINVWKVWPQHLHAELETTDSVGAVAFSPDGQVLASGGRDRILTLWDLQTGKPRFILEGHATHILSIAFSPTQPIVASADRNGTIRLWDLSRRALIRSVAGHSNQVFSVDFSPDGLTLASGGRDNTVRLWDVPTGKQQLALAGHDASVVDVEFSPSGHTLASCDERGVVLLWRSDDTR